MLYEKFLQAGTLSDPKVSNTMNRMLTALNDSNVDLPQCLTATVATMAYMSIALEQTPEQVIINFKSILEEMHAIKKIQPEYASVFDKDNPSHVASHLAGKRDLGFGD